MINDDSISKVHAATFKSRYRRPAYDSYCFGNVPSLIHSLFDTSVVSTLPKEHALKDCPREPKKVVLFFVDSFGWEFFERDHTQHAVIRELEQNGCVSKLTSLFPSTTAAHVTCIHSGQVPSESGVFEFYFYEPTVGEIINPLLYSFLSDCTNAGRKRDTLAEAGFPASQLLPSTNIYDKLNKLGVSSFVYQNQNYAHSEYSKALCRGSNLHGFKDFRDGLQTLSRNISSNQEREYHFIYTDAVDDACHTYGPHSDEVRTAIDETFALIEEEFLTPCRGKLSDTLLLFIADHGHIPMSPETTVNLDQTIPDIHKLLRSGKSGELLVPAGSPRDMFLYARDGASSELFELLKEHLDGTAAVFTCEELINEGFFRDTPVSTSFRERLGDLVLISEEGQSVWWSGDGRFTSSHRGHHGGLFPREMEIPLIAYPLG